MIQCPPSVIYPAMFLPRGGGGLGIYLNIDGWSKIKVFPPYAVKWQQGPAQTGRVFFFPMRNAMNRKSYVSLMCITFLLMAVAVQKVFSKPKMNCHPARSVAECLRRAKRLPRPLPLKP